MVKASLSHCQAEGKKASKKKKSFVVVQDDCLYYHNIKCHFSWKDETGDSIGPICLNVVGTGIQYMLRF